MLMVNLFECEGELGSRGEGFREDRGRIGGVEVGRTGHNKTKNLEALYTSRESQLWNHVLQTEIP